MNIFKPTSAQLGQLLAAHMRENASKPSGEFAVAVIRTACGELIALDGQERFTVGAAAQARFGSLALLVYHEGSEERILEWVKTDGDEWSLAQE